VDKDNIKINGNREEGNKKNYNKPFRYNKPNFDKRENQSKPSYVKNHNDGKILTVIVPVLNEEESVPELSLLLEGELEKVTHGNYEVIFIDDGSTDNSFNEIKKVHDRNKRFKGIKFRRNYGKSAALAVGFAESKGVIVITMDADLQDDPAEIPNLVNKLKEGYDMVSGWKKKRNDPITKTIPSKVINFLTKKLTRVNIHDMNCGLKAYRQEVVKTLQIYGEMHRYIPALASWEGFRVAEIPVQHHARKFGKSKYGFTRFIKGFLDLLTVMFTTRYFKRPLHFFGTIGSIFTGSGFLIDLYLLIEWFMEKTALSNRPLTLFGIALIIVGIQLISLGLIGEMIVKNSMQKPNYSIKEKIF
jgi:glycosyltransferase involved in cell wall biosynthesis